MDPTVLQALEKAVEAGGSDLTGKVIAGAGKKASKILNDLYSSGFLHKTAGKPPKYNLTPEGRAAWESQVLPERRRELQERQGRQERKNLGELLTLIRQKSDSPLTKRDIGRFPPTLLQDACDRGLVEPGAKKNSYRLLPAGEEHLLADQPLEQQLQQLRQLHQKTVAHWRAVQQSLRQELDGIGGQASEGLQTATGQLSEKALQAHQTFEQVLSELGAFPALLNAARQIRAEVDAAYREARKRMESEAARLTDLEMRLGQANKQQREQLEAFEQRIEGRLDDLARRVTLPTDHNKTSPAGVHDPHMPVEADIWDATGRAYRQLKQETIRIGGIVKVPELSDQVRKQFSGLSAASFHNLLEKWQREDRLTLQLCNDPRLEPRADEGLKSARGLLFYVQLR